MTGTIIDATPNQIHDYVTGKPKEWPLRFSVALWNVILKGLEAGASYWHLVDLLWIFLFALLYLLR